MSSATRLLPVPPPPLQRLPLRGPAPALPGGGLVTFVQAASTASGLPLIRYGTLVVRALAWSIPFPPGRGAISHLSRCRDLLHGSGVCHLRFRSPRPPSASGSGSRWRATVLRIRLSLPDFSIPGRGRCRDQPRQRPFLRSGAAGALASSPGGMVLYPLGRRRRAEGRFRGFCGGSGTTGVVKVWDADGCLRAAAGPHRPRPTVERERDRHGATGVTEIDDNG